MDTSFLLINPLPSPTNPPAALVVLVISFGMVVLVTLLSDPGEVGLRIREVCCWSLVLNLGGLLAYWIVVAFTEDLRLQGIGFPLWLVLAIPLCWVCHRLLTGLIDSVYSSQWMFHRRYKAAVRDLDRIVLDAHGEIDEIDRQSRQRVQVELSKTRRTGGHR